jgi:hypothetical protein
MADTPYVTFSMQSVNVLCVDVSIDARVTQLLCIARCGIHVECCGRRILAVLTGSFVLVGLTYSKHFQVYSHESVVDCDHCSVPR